MYINMYIRMWHMLVCVQVPAEYTRCPPLSLSFLLPPDLELYCTRTPQQPVFLFCTALWIQALLQWCLASYVGFRLRPLCLHSK